MANRYFTQFHWSLEKDPVLLFAKVGMGYETDVSTVADVSSSLAGTFFRIKGFVTGNQYYFWFTVAGVGNNPNNTGEVGIKVNFAVNATATQVAAAIAAAAALTPSFVQDFSIATSTIHVVFTPKAGGDPDAKNGLSMYNPGFSYAETLFAALVTSASKGIKTFAKNGGTGLYKVTFGTPSPTSTTDLYNRVFYTDQKFLVASGTPAAPLMFVVSQAVASLGTIDLRFTAVDGTTSTDPALSEEIWLEFYLKNTTAQ